MEQSSELVLSSSIFYLLVLRLERVPNNKTLVVVSTQVVTTAINDSGLTPPKTMSVIDKAAPPI